MIAHTTQISHARLHATTKCWVMIADYYTSVNHKRAEMIPQWHNANHRTLILIYIGAREVLKGGYS